MRALMDFTGATVRSVPCCGRQRDVLNHWPALVVQTAGRNGNDCSKRTCTRDKQSPAKKASGGPVGEGRVGYSAAGLLC